MKQLNSIQYLRAIAALLVLYCHAIDLQEFFSTSFQQHFFYLENFGGIGVDIFFVISGFIITYISQGKTGASESIDFLKRRIIRLVPAYYIVSLMLLLLVLIAGYSTITKENILKTFTILPLLDSGTESWSAILFLGWTLGFEFFFYLIFSIIMFLNFVRKEIAVVVLFIILVIAGRIFPVSNVQWQFITNPIILEFCFGVLIAMIYKSAIGVSLRLSKIFIVTGILLIITLIFTGYGNITEMADTVNGSNSLLRTILWGIPSAVLVFGLVFFEKNSIVQPFTNKWILLLGNASYSIYLIHIIVYRLIHFLLIRNQGVISILPGDLQIPVYMFIAIVCSVIFHILIEKNILKLLNKKK